MELSDKILACKEKNLRKALNSSISVLSDALRLFGPEKITASFNGGKDAVVVLHLFRAAMAQHSLETGMTYHPNAVYFNLSGEFPAVSEIDLSLVNLSHVICCAAACVK